MTYDEIINLPEEDEIYQLYWMDGYENGVFDLVKALNMVYDMRQNINVIRDVADAITNDK